MQALTLRRTLREHPALDLAPQPGPGDGAGPPPEYCQGRGHTKVTAWRERGRLAAAEADRDAAIEQARAEASQQVSAAEADRDQTFARAAQAEQATRLAQQETARAQAGERAARAEAGRVRADADKMLTGFRADAARDRDELRADLPGPGRARRTSGRRLPRRPRPATHRDQPRRRYHHRQRDATSHQAGHPAVTRPRARGERRAAHPGRQWAAKHSLRSPLARAASTACPKWSIRTGMSTRCGPKAPASRASRRAAARAARHAILKPWRSCHMRASDLPATFSLARIRAGTWSTRRSLPADRCGYQAERLGVNKLPLVSRA